MSSSVGDEGKSGLLGCAAPAGTNEPPPLFAVGAAVEELDGLRDHFDLRALASVLRLPRRPVEPAVDADPAPLGEMLRQHLGLVAEDLHVEEVRLVHPLATRVLLAAVDGEAELQHGAPGR